MHGTLQSFNDCVALDIRLSEHHPELSGQRIVPKHSQGQDDLVQMIDQADGTGRDWMTEKAGSRHPRCQS
jgi:hypothetical protein